jgi:hypothetical protein
MTGDASGILNLNSNGTNVVAVTSTGATVTGTLAATGAVSGTTGTFTSTLGVTGAITGSSTVAGSTGILYPLTSGTAVASTSGTSIDFTGIPSWVKRITMMFNEVSTNGASNRLVQIGAGSVTTSGYVSSASALTSATSTTSSTAGFIIFADGATYILSGHMVLTLISANTWISSHTCKAATTQQSVGAGSLALGGTLDRIRITTVNGTDTFDAGSVNILYE